jgi:hypothetical protein
MAAVMMVQTAEMVVCRVVRAVRVDLMVVLMVLMAEMVQTVTAAITKRIHMLTFYPKSQNKYRIKRIKKRSQLNKPQISHRHNPYNHLQELLVETLLHGRRLHLHNLILRHKAMISREKTAQAHYGRFQSSKKRKVKRD